MTPAPHCSYCQTSMGEGEAATACPSCGATHHEDCWGENGGCSVYGCQQTPATDARTALEIPVSWWGRENKPCPACGQEILAAALRCRHCGATFSSARPEERAEFQQRTQVSNQHPELRRRVLWQFILSVLPLTAPIGAVIGLVWYLPNRAKIATLPSVFPALAFLGLLVGSILTVAYIVLASLYGWLH